MFKELVIAAYDKDVSWLKEIDLNVKITIYRKGNKPYSNEIVLTPNVGRDVHTFFNHIYERYDTLADTTFFAQDYPFDHWEHIVGVVNGDENKIKAGAQLVIGGYYGYHFNTITTPSPLGGIMWSLHKSQHHDSGYIIACEANGMPQADPNVHHLNLAPAWDLFFEDSAPPFYEFMPGGHFGITKEHAKLRSKTFYKEVVEFLATNPFAPWLVERLECYMFNPKYRTRL